MPRVRGAMAYVGFSATLLAAIALVPAATAQTYPDFESQWKNPNTDRGDAWDPSKPPGLAQQPPLTAEYQAIFEASVRDQAAGGRGNNYKSSCVLDGMPRLMSLTAPMEILIEPRLTFVIFQSAFVRRIHTDGAPMPKDEPPSYQGYATGRWIDEDGDGRYDAFEVETRNFKGPRAFESSGLPLYNDNQTVIHERLSLDKSNRDLLHNVITTHDRALTRPWTVHKTYRRERNPHWDEYSCQPPPNAVFIGLEEYRLSPDHKLMPLRPGQPPPDLRYFKQPQK
jgi:hypothetical protein